MKYGKRIVHSFMHRNDAYMITCSDNNDGRLATSIWKREEWWFTPGQQTPPEAPQSSGQTVKEDV